MGILTLGEHLRSVEERDPELAQALHQEISRAEQQTGENFDDYRIRSIAEMGRAIGMCDNCKHEQSLRADVVGDVGTVRRHLAATLKHENTHDVVGGMGVLSEGFTEMITATAMGISPVPDYREKVEHARHLAGRIGLSQAVEAARGRDWQRTMLIAWVSASVKDAANTDEKGFEAIVKEGAEHIQAAA